MRAYTFAALLLLGAVSGALADQPSSSAAAHAAATGDYRLAAQNYQQLLDSNGFSAAVLFNLGNDWLRLGKPARAILEYERALVLAPRSAAIASNLAAARERAGITAPAVGPWLAAARYLRFDTYVWLGVGGLWVLCCGVVLLCLRGRARRIARPLILVAAVTLCVSVDAVALGWSDLDRAVVLQPASLHLAPAVSAAVSGALRAGEVVWTQDRYGGFSFVRTADGHTGWVGADAAVPVRVARP